VADHQGRILYYSDIEEGWAIERPDSAGGIADRDCSQFELSHVLWQVFGDPEQLRGWSLPNQPQQPTSRARAHPRDQALRARRAKRVAHGSAPGWNAHGRIAAASFKTIPSRKSLVACSHVQPPSRLPSIGSCSS
jgi:hypothetical protein